MTEIEEVIPVESGKAVDAKRADVEKSASAATVPDGRNLGLVRRVLEENGREFLPQYLLAFALMAIVSGLTGASAWIMKYVFNEVLVAKNEALIAGLALAIFAIFAGRGLADYGQTIMMNRIGRTITSREQKRFFERLLARDMHFYNTASVGRVIVFLSNGAQSVRNIMNLVVTGVGKDLLSVLSLGAVMVVMDPVLSLIAFLVTPAALVSLNALKARIRRLGKNEFKGIADVFSGVKEVMVGIRVVKSFGLEARFEEGMARNIEMAAQRSVKLGNLTARSGPIMEGLVGVALAAIIIYAGLGIDGQARDAGSLLAFLAALLLTYAPAKNLARLHLNIERAMSGLAGFYRFIDQETPRDVPDAQPIIIDKGAVEFRNVNFSYGAAPALTDLSIHFPAGKVSALVGASGSGKSTILALIERFYEPQSGEVVIDGRDIRLVTTESLRKSMAFVTQDPFLFEGTIRDNIKSGRWDATEAEIVAAAKAAHAHEFIIEHPDGYDRRAGEGGANLSGGQKQRIAIARAIIRDAPILLLDEATSALDAVSEEKVREAIGNLMKDRTTIVIAHRLSTVRQADIIHVMESGRLIESGPHAELLARAGRYAELVALELSPT
jgi:ATP-binding cassette, subfamily B, bacterial MsbA